MTGQQRDSLSQLSLRAVERLPVVDPERDTLLLDVDGTILDIAPTPGSVFVPPGLVSLLSRLQHKFSGALALVSGRRLGDLDRLFRPWTFAAIGGHGAELRPWTNAGLSVVTASPLDAALREAIIGIAADNPDVQVEDKLYSIALHYRLAPEKELPLRAAITMVLKRMGRTDLQILRGREIFEVKPRTFNKGVAVLALMNTSPFRGRRPIFLGDDVTDEDVFAVMPEFDGIAISVGRRLAGADCDFESPAQVRGWLHSLAEQSRNTLQ